MKIIVFSLFASLTYLTTPLISQSYELLQLMNKINSYCPLMADKDTRMDNVVVFDNTIQYNYTFVNHTYREISSKHIQSLKPNILESYKSNKQLEEITKRNITVVYSYSDKFGRFITSFKITPEEYKNIPSSGQYNNLFPKYYGAELLQTGGEGSRQVQVRTYSLDDHAYFRNTDSMVCYFFNSVADILWICDPEGYKVTSAKVYDNGYWYDAEYLNGQYYIRIKNQLQNKVKLQIELK